MKLKKVQSKKLCLSIAALAVLGSSNLGAVSINNASDFSSNFTQTQTGTGEYSYTGTDTTIDFASDSSFEGANKIIVPADKKVTSINLGNTTPPTDDYANFCLGCENVEDYDLSATTINIKQYAELQVKRNSNLRGDVVINSGSTLNPTDDWRKNGSIFMVNGYDGGAGRLNITGKLTINNAGIWYADRELQGGLIKVNGDVNIKNSFFDLSYQDVNNFTANNYELIRTDTKFNNDITTSNQVRGILLAFPSLATGQVDPDLEYEAVGEINLNSSGFTQYTLSLSNDGKSLLANGGATDKVKDLNALFGLKKEMYQSIIDKLDKLNNNTSDTALKSKITQAKQQAEELKNKVDTTQNPNNANSSSVLIETMANISQDERALANTLFDSLGSSALSNDIVSKVILASIADNGATLKRVVNDLNSNATSQANANSASSSVSSTMNLSNDMAIGSRLASLNNPFANLAYAKKLSKAYFASGSSDVRLDYGLNDLTQSRWANVFGGVNIIDSKSGGVYGLSLGVDKKIKDNAILGFYASFAKATLKDKSLEQKSSNFQVGTYSSIAFSNDLELGLKAYLGVAPTEQESFYSLAGISNSTSEYARLSAGINANLGKNFALSEDTLFIKPFVGTNYYLTHTPEYTEQGGLAKNVKSANNNSISLELGAEFRKYFNEFAYFYTTPKIEQFVYNQSDDFSASFIGSNTGFNIQSDDKLKTYAQLILGASMNFTDNFAATASFAGKQIVAGKVDKKNETYMSGNLELRYRF